MGLGSPDPDQNKEWFDMQCNDQIINELNEMSRIPLILTLILGMALSGPGQADVTITQLANEGVLIAAGQARILVDGMVVEPYSVYGGLPPDVAGLFDQAAGPFAGVDLALASHRHHDHNQPKFACNFLGASPDTKFASSTQVLDLMREKCRSFVTSSPRISIIDPQYGQPVYIDVEGARVTAFPLSHGTGKYARLQNYGHLVEIGDMTVLHIGDAAMNPEDFSRAGLDQVDLDVVLIPFWFFQPGPGMQVVEKFLDAPNKIAVHIPPGEMAEIAEYMDAEYPQVLILKNPLDEVSFSAERPSLH
jgi:L-ascorbate metabolism protein UlaG (beta-lactamase superfamily)